MFKGYLTCGYGFCQRALCDKQNVIPIGTHDKPSKGRIKVYCPKCEEVYIPCLKSVNLDGAFFGQSFGHEFLLEYKDSVVLPPKIYFYEPQISGFKIFGKRGSKYHQPTAQAV